MAIFFEGTAFAAFKEYQQENRIPFRGGGVPQIKDTPKLFAQSLQILTLQGPPLKPLSVEIWLWVKT